MILFTIRLEMGSAIRAWVLASDLRGASVSGPDCRSQQERSLLPVGTLQGPSSPFCPPTSLKHPGRALPQLLSTTRTSVPARSWKGLGTSPAAQPVGGVGHPHLLASLLWPEPSDFVLWQDTLSCARAVLGERVAVGASPRGRARCSLPAGKLPVPERVLRT